MLAGLRATITLPAQAFGGRTLALKTCFNVLNTLDVSTATKSLVPWRELFSHQGAEGVLVAFDGRYTFELKRRGHKTNFERTCFTSTVF